MLDKLLDRAKNNLIEPSLRFDLAKHGQHPSAIIICCSDSRVVPELIFNVGLGAFFVVRTAGNTLGENEYRSIEYAHDHLHVDECIVMGHTQCGAIASCLESKAIENPLLRSIAFHIKDERDPRQASILNALEVKREIIERMGEGLNVHALLYDIENGFIENLDILED